ncbi:MAG: hypothetical protein KBD76_03545 [Bacteriovorax sp.]|nr:hypothetical protein [Bacteriovorax sp.]
MLSLSLLILISEEIYAKRWLLHRGILYPRFFLLKPITFITYPFIEWIIIAFCSIAIWIKKYRFWAIRIAFITIIPSSLMVFSNHKFLFLMVLFFLSITYQDAPSKENISCSDLPGLSLVKIQLVIVYYISVVQKLSENFVSGDSLRNLLIFITRMPDGAMLPSSVHHFLIQNNQFCSILAAGTILAEILIPLLLNKKPILGLIILIALHTALSFLMPGVWAFSFIMFSMGVLFLRNWTE